MNTIVEAISKLKFAVQLLFLLCLPFFLWWMDRWALNVAPEAYLGWNTILANALPVWWLIVLLAALSGRVVFSTLIVSAISAGIYLVSSIKVQVLEQPVILQDFYFITRLDTASVKLFAAYLNEFSLSNSTMALLAVVLLGLIFWLEGRYFRLSGKMRLSGLGVALASGILAWYALWPVNVIYNKQLLRPQVTDQIAGVLHAGLFSNLVYRHVDLLNLDLSADAKVIASGFQHLQKAALWPPAKTGPRNGTPAEGRPDIIVILSESFMDPRVISGFDHLSDVIPNFRRIAASSSSGAFKPPTYGGGTLRTEFEILTGMPIWAFQTDFPYLELPIRTELPGLASFLAGYEYRRFAIHGNVGRFWNRNSTYQAMGITEFKTIDDFIANGIKDGRFYSDESMTDLLLEQLSRDYATPAFAAVISIQAHGPYTGILPQLREPDVFHALELPPMHSALADEELRTYLYHIHMADRQLGRLVAALEQRGRPWRLLFFGDHLPGFRHAWGEVRFVDGKSPQQQEVPWLIAGGDDVKIANIQESWQLPSALLENAGFDLGDDFLGFSSAVGKARYGDLDSPGAGTNEPWGGILGHASRANLIEKWADHVQD